MVYTPNYSHLIGINDTNQEIRMAFSSMAISGTDLLEVPTIYKAIV